MSKNFNIFWAFSFTFSAFGQLPKESRITELEMNCVSCITIRKDRQGLLLFSISSPHYTKYRQLDRERKQEMEKTQHQPKSSSIESQSQDDSKQYRLLSQVFHFRFTKQLSYLDKPAQHFRRRNVSLVILA